MLTITEENINRVSEQVYNKVYMQVSGQVWMQVSNPVCIQVSHRSWDRVTSIEVRDQIRSQAVYK
jgi:hypothetical protein